MPPGSACRGGSGFGRVGVKAKKFLDPSQLVGRIGLWVCGGRHVVVDWPCRICARAS